MRIVLNKFVSYLYLDKEKTSKEYEAYVAMSELEIEGETISFIKKSQPNLIKALNNKEVIDCKIAITNEVFKCKVIEKTSNQFTLEVLQETSLKVSKNNTLQMVIDMTSNDTVENIKFRKHIYSILTDDFFNSYFNEFSDMNEVNKWLVNYRDNWIYI